MKKLISLPSDEEDSLHQMIRDLAGDDIADDLSRLLGGKRISIPSLKRLKPTDRVAIALGYERACKLAEAVVPEKYNVVEWTVPYGKYAFYQTAYRTIDGLIRDGLSAQNIAEQCGVSMRLVFRRRAALRQAGEAIPVPKRFPEKRAHDTPSSSIRGGVIVRHLLLEGYAPSLLRDIMNIPPKVIFTIRAELLKQGKLK